MKTHAQVKAEFTADLLELLHKWNAVLEAKVAYRGYPDYGDDPRIAAIIQPRFDKDKRQVHPFLTVNFGNYITPGDEE